MTINIGDLQEKLGRYRTQESLYRAKAVSAADSQNRAELSEIADKWHLLAEETASLIRDLAADGPVRIF